MEILKTKGSPLLSRHMPLHQLGLDDDWRGDNHRVLRWYAAGGSLPVEKLCEMPHMCSRIRNQDSPSDSNGRPLSGNFHQRLCYGQRVEAPLSMALFVPRL